MLNLHDIIMCKRQAGLIRSQVASVYYRQFPEEQHILPQYPDSSTYSNLTWMIGLLYSRWADGIVLKKPAQSWDGEGDGRSRSEIMWWHLQHPNETNLQHLPQGLYLDHPERLLFLDRLSEGNSCGNIPNRCTFHCYVCMYVATVRCQLLYTPILGHSCC